jgi:hypothetical protein
MIGADQSKRPPSLRYGIISLSSVGPHILYFVSIFYLGLLVAHLEVLMIPYSCSASTTRSLSDVRPIESILVKLGRKVTSRKETIPLYPSTFLEVPFDPEFVLGELIGFAWGAG